MNKIRPSPGGTMFVGHHVLQQCWQWFLMFIQRTVLSYFSFRVNLLPIISPFKQTRILYITPFNPLSVCPFVCPFIYPFVRQNHLWAQRALRRGSKEAPRRVANFLYYIFEWVLFSILLSFIQILWHNTNGRFTQLWSWKLGYKSGLYNITIVLGWVSNIQEDI